MGFQRYQTIAMPGLSLTQSYSYNHLNRLKQAQETGGSGWTQRYGYDVTGNRWVSVSPGPLSLTTAIPQAQGWFDPCIGLWETASFNNRLQPTAVNLGIAQSGANAASVWGLANTYGSLGVNNGNVTQQSITAPGMAIAEAYTFDGVLSCQTCHVRQPRFHPTRWTRLKRVVADTVDLQTLFPFLPATYKINAQTPPTPAAKFRS